MLVVALVIADLVANVRAQTRVAGARERRTSLLYAMSRELAATRSFDDLARVAVETCRGDVRQPCRGAGSRRAGGICGIRRALAMVRLVEGPDLSVAQWVFDHGAPAGLGTDTLPAASRPIPAAQRNPPHARAYWRSSPTQRRRLLLPEQRHLIETFAGQIALAIERAGLQEEAEQSRVAAETEGLRNTLLASISHDLRTPLAVITGASSALSDPTMTFDQQARRSLAAQIETKSREMTEIISNVLDLMRLESGQLSLRLDWVMVDDLVSSALERLGARLIDHPVESRVPTDLPPVHVDSALMLQVFTNLLENVAKHTPAGTHATVDAVLEDQFVRVSIEDTGPGLPGEDLEKLFAKFHRGRDESNAGGAGLGLSICRAIVTAHGGRIDASQRPGGGARFSFTLPVA